MKNRALIINGGSSSLKFALYTIGKHITRTFSGIIKNIGSKQNVLHITDTKRQELLSHSLPDSDLPETVQKLVEWMRHQPDLIVHRIVHGGSLYSAPVLITSGVLSYLESVIPLAPDHLPSELKCVEMFRKIYPGIPQIACFDTAFHQTMPDQARQYPLSKKLRGFGIIRYGFHGLSFEHLLLELKKLKPELAMGKLILAHLGNGASMAAVDQGKCIDTTMGFTPTGGLMMGTRSGDLDPGILLYLLREKKLSTDELVEEINHQSGLKGISEETADAAALIERFADDDKAAGTIRHFCYLAKKHIGMLAAALGGLDAIVFSGGIGENAPLIRTLTCNELGFLGVRIDESSNLKNKQKISEVDSKVSVFIIPANEEEMMAIHARDLQQKQT